MNQLPAELSITEFATLIGAKRHRIEHRVETGEIPSYKAGLSPNSPRVIILEELRKHHEGLYEVVLRRLTEMSEDQCEDDDD